RNRINSPAGSAHLKRGTTGAWSYRVPGDAAVLRDQSSHGLHYFPCLSTSACWEGVEWVRSLPSEPLPSGICDVSFIATQRIFLGGHRKYRSRPPGTARRRKCCQCNDEREY